MSEASDVKEVGINIETLECIETEVELALAKPGMSNRQQAAYRGLLKSCANVRADLIIQRSKTLGAKPKATGGGR